MRCRAVLLLIREVKICAALNKENAIICRAENADGGLMNFYRAKQNAAPGDFAERSIYSIFTDFDK